MSFPNKIVIFHSFVNLPEGTYWETSPAPTSLVTFGARRGGHMRQTRVQVRLMLSTFDPGVKVRGDQEIHLAGNQSIYVDLMEVDGDLMKIQPSTRQ